MKNFFVYLCYVWHKYFEKHIFVMNNNFHGTKENILFCSNSFHKLRQYSTNFYTLLISSVFTNMNNKKMRTRNSEFVELWDLQSNLIKILWRRKCLEQRRRALEEVSRSASDELRSQNLACFKWAQRSGKKLSEEVPEEAGDVQKLACLVSSGRGRKLLEKQCK